MLALCCVHTLPPAPSSFDVGEFDPPFEVLHRRDSFSSHHPRCCRDLRTSLAPGRVPETLTHVFALPQHVGLAPTYSGGARTQGGASKSLPSPGHWLLCPGKATDPGTADKPLSFGSEALAGRMMQPRTQRSRGTLPTTLGLSHPRSHPQLCQGSPCIAGMAAGAERGRLSLAGAAAAGSDGSERCSACSRTLPWLPRRILARL